MAIYGTALLSICVLIGTFAGQILGRFLGLNTNVGGVGIAMILLIIVNNTLRKNGAMKPQTEEGILFWSSIYIPIVVALAATQNVRAAINGGPAAILAGTLAVIACFALVPVINRIGLPKNPQDRDA